MPRDIRQPQLGKGIRLAAAATFYSFARCDSFLYALRVLMMPAWLCWPAAYPAAFPGVERDERRKPCLPKQASRECAIRITEH